RSVLALGIGRYPNPLETRFEHLTDPMVSATARTLSDAIAVASAADGRILVGAGGGLEAVIVLMLRRALPRAVIGYAAEAKARPSDLVVDLVGESRPTPGRTVSLARADALLTNTRLK